MTHLFSYPCTDTTLPAIVALIASAAKGHDHPDWFTHGAENWLEDHPEPEWLRHKRVPQYGSVKTPARLHAIAKSLTEGPDVAEQTAWADGYRWAAANTGPSC